MPDLRTSRAHLTALGKVPAEQQAMVADAEAYIKMRDESWRLRANALHKLDMRGLRDADKAERASLEAFEKIRGQRRTDGRWRRQMQRDARHEAAPKTLDGR